jgi:hypothetical protein
MVLVNGYVLFAHKVKLPRASLTQGTALPSLPQEKTGSVASANGLNFFPVGEKLT